MDAQPLLILGSGTFAVETLDIAEAAGGFAPLGFVNSVERPAPGAMHADLPVFWVDDVPFAPDDCALVAGIVSTQRRAFVEQMTQRGYRFVTVAHPSAVISRRAQVLAGSVINAGAIIAQNAVIGEHVIVNRGALIGHDIRLASFCTVGPGANIAGGVTVGEGAYIGVGAVVRDHVDIGAGAIVGAGAVVVKSVPPGVLVLGMPAQIVKTNVKGL